MFGKFNLSTGSSVTINGKTYKGDCVTVTPEGVVIDGATIEYTNTKIINLTVTGDTGNIEISSGSITVEGNCNGKINTQSGDVEVTGVIEGNVSTMSGDVEAGVIKGSVKTMSGDITTLK